MLSAEFDVRATEVIRMRTGRYTVRGIIPNVLQQHASGDGRRVMREVIALLTRSSRRRTRRRLIEGVRSSRSAVCKPA